MTIGVDDLLWIEGPGLSEAAAGQALAAARAALAEKGLDAAEGFAAFRKREHVAEIGQRLPKHERELAEAWADAQYAASIAVGIEVELYPAQAGQERHQSGLRNMASRGGFDAPDFGPIYRFGGEGLEDDKR